MVLVENLRLSPLLLNVRTMLLCYMLIYGFDINFYDRMSDISVGKLQNSLLFIKDYEGICDKIYNLFIICHILITVLSNYILVIYKCN